MKKNTQTLKSNNNLNMFNNLCNTKFGDRGLSNCASLLWDRLQAVNKIVVFKKLLKTHFFVQNFRKLYIST